MVSNRSTLPDLYEASFMRRSIYDGEPREFSVTLNGQPLDDVIWADEAEGKAEIFEHESLLCTRGARVVDPSQPLGVRTITVTGKIQITEKDVPPSPTPEQTTFEYLMGSCP